VRGGQANGGSQLSAAQSNSLRQSPPPMRQYQAADGLSPPDSWSVGGYSEKSPYGYPQQQYPTATRQNGNGRDYAAYPVDRSSVISYTNSAEPSYATGPSNGARDYTRGEYNHRSPADAWSQGQNTLSRSRPTTAGNYDGYGTSTSGTLSRDPSGGHYAAYNTPTSSTLPRNFDRDDRFNQGGYGTMPRSLSQNDSVSNGNMLLFAKDYNSFMSSVVQ
jgi:hypothetical protein